MWISSSTPHTFTHSLTLSLTHPFIHSLNHSLSPPHTFTYSPCRFQSGVSDFLCLLCVCVSCRIEGRVNTNDHVSTDNPLPQNVCDTQITFTLVGHTISILNVSFTQCSPYVISSLCHTYRHNCLKLLLRPQDNRVEFSHFQRNVLLRHWQSCFLERDPDMLIPFFVLQCLPGSWNYGQGWLMTNMVKVSLWQSWPRWWLSSRALSRCIREHCLG